LIVIDYVRKFNTDEFQRGLFLTILFSAFLAVLSDFVSRCAEGTPGKTVSYAIYALVALFYISQNLAYYLMVVFLNYFVRKNGQAAKKALVITVVFLSVYSVFTILSLPRGFFFYVSDANRFTPGRFYALRLVISYLPILLIAANSIISRKYFSGTQIYMLIFFGILNGGGAALDIVMQNSSLTWPCFAAAALYIYFFIVQCDARADALTGIGNRAAFNDFIANLSRQTIKHSYSIAMIDMNDFKSINDTYGHSAGDKALVEMAQIIKNCIRNTDFAARYGGDEFIIAIKAHHNMARLMERIEESIASRNEKSSLPYKLSISYGYDCYTARSPQSIDDFLKHIDQLMYEHKARLKAARSN
jgi:diguanylate cyclase (GGDEF)-like protein